MGWRCGRIGTALIAVLIFLSAIAAIMGTMASTLHILRTARLRQDVHAEAAQVAHAGVEHTIWVLGHAPEARSVQGEIGPGQYEAILSPVPDKAGQWEIRSTGRVDGRRGGVCVCRLGAIAQTGDRVRIVAWLE
jgi:hypothetical protein